MALAANTNRIYEIGEDSVIPVLATAQIYDGSAVGSSGGYARALVAGDLFLGFARENKLGGASSALVNITVAAVGKIQLAISAAAVTDLGKAVYASDDGTFTFTSTSNSRIGTMTRFVSTGIVIVEFRTSSIQTLAGVSALTDNSGGAVADGTIAVVTAPTAITDNTTGTTTATFAAGVGVYDLTFAVSLINTGAVDVVTAVVIGHKFKILSWEFVTSGVKGVGSSASRVYNMEIGTTDVGTTPSTLTLTEASTSDFGERTSGTTVTGANTGSASDTFSIEVATGGTDFTAGSGTIVIKIQNMDTADSIAGICTAQTANRAAIIALTNAIAELATKDNEVIAALP